MSATLTQVLPLLKEHYHDNIVDIFFEADKVTTPIMANMETKSMDDGLGRGYIIPIEYGQGSSVSGTFSVAQSKAQGSTVGSAALRDRWNVPATTLDAIAVWTRDAMLAAMGKGADELFDVMQREMDSKISLVKKRLAQISVEQGFGRVGTISAITTTTITISTSEINRVDVGDDLVAAAAHTSGVLRSATSIRVTGWDPDTGIITLSADPTALAWAAADTVFFAGDRDNAATPTKLLPTGLGGWLPSTAPGVSDSFFGINRFGVPNLGGHRINASGLDHATAFIRAVNRLFKYGSKASVVYTSAEDFAVLAADKDATKIVTVELGKYKIGFDGVSVSTQAGNVPVLPDAMVPQGTAWLGPFDDKRYAPFFAHNDDLVNIDDIDGNTVLRLASASSFEMRLYFRGAVALPAPGKFAVINNLPSA